MTKNDTTTAAMTVEAATAITAEIKACGKTLATARTKFANAVTAAKDGQAHTALGFKSWPEYVATVFEGMPGLGVKDREYLTGFMAGEGMSSRAISRVLGVSQSTANRMVKALEETGDVDPERKIDSNDGIKRSKGKTSTKTSTKKTTPKADSPTKITDLKTDDLRGLAKQIMVELVNRSFAGDVAAEMALAELSEDTLTLL